MGFNPLSFTTDVLASGGARHVESPNLFAKGSVGGLYQDYLKDLYSEDVTQSKLFGVQSTALRDLLSREAGGAAEQLGYATNRGGFFDSGARVAGLGEINRGKMFAFSQGLAEIISRLESAKLQAAAPWLSAKLGAYSEFQNALTGADQERNTRQGINASVLNSVTGGASQVGAAAV